MDRGLPRDRVEAEPDLGGLAADGNLRGVDRVSPAEAAERAGLTVEEAHRVWLSLGVATRDEHEPAFTDQEAAVLTFFADGRELFGETVVLQVLRVLGSAVTRIADAEVGALRLAYEVPFVQSGASDVELVDGYGYLTRMLLPEVEVMFAADDLTDGLAIGRAVAAALGEDDGLPPGRVGLACGQVLSRDGDYYGSVVNLAARLVALADPGVVLISEPVAAAVPSSALEPLAPVEVKGFAEPVPAFRLRD